MVRFLKAGFFAFALGLSVGWLISKVISLKIQSVEVPEKHEDGNGIKKNTDGINPQQIAFLWESGILGTMQEENGREESETQQMQKEEEQETEKQIREEEVKISPLASSYKLVGTVVGNKLKLAILEERRRKGEFKILTVGDELERGVKVVRIERLWIDLSRNGSVERIFLFERDESEFAKARAERKRKVQPVSPLASAPRDRNSTDRDFDVDDEGREIVQVSPDTFEVSRSFVEKHLTNISGLLMSARAVPFIRDGKISGFRLINIRKGSFYDKIGLVNGDVITSINGTPLSNIDALLKIFSEIKNETYFEVEVERGGVRRVFKYYIK